MIAVLHPSFWQQSVAGLIAISVVLVPLSVGLWWLERAVLVPRRFQRAWSEGARVRPLVEAIVSTRRRRAPGGQDDWVVGVRFGCALAVCAVVPLSTGLVTAQPTLGIFVLPVALAVDALASRCVGRVAMAALIGLVAGGVAVQWGSCAVPTVVAAQAQARVMTAWVQPWLLVIAVIGLHDWFARAIDVSLDGSSLVDQALVVAVAAWLVAVFLGGGSVPWTVTNPGTRQTLSVVVFLTKLGLVSVGLVWARVTWSCKSDHGLRRFLVSASSVAVVAIGVTALLRR